ncbi:MAG TPA: ABC transporter ATP-binding protein [Actinocrinis sp.]
MRFLRGQPKNGRQAWGLLWGASRPLSAAVVAWTLANAVIPTLVVVCLGAVVGAIPGTVEHGISAPQGRDLIIDLVITAVVYAFSLVTDSVGNALGTAARSRISGRLQRRLLDAVSTPVGVAHLEDSSVLDRLARAEGTLTGYFPGDAPVTWVGIIGTRLSGVIACGFVAAFRWWLGLMLLVIWLAVRRVLLKAVVRQAIQLRTQTTTMRRAGYFIGVGTKARDGKEMRVFGLPTLISGLFRREYRAALDGGVSGLRELHLRAACCLVAVLAGYCTALAMIAVAARDHTIDLRTLATVIPMLAVTMSAGSVSMNDLMLAWSLAGLPDVDSLEQELTAKRGELAGARDPEDLPRRAVVFEDVAFRYPAAQRDVLAGLGLTLAAGTSTAIVGVNGAGKSTLVSLLSRLRDPTGGRITVDGVDVRDLDPARWQRAVAVVPQAPVRYPVSAYANVAFGAWEHGDDREGVEEAARTSGFLDVVGTLPEGWDTVLARELPGGVDLSGGQWQRLALARALFATRHGARLLVLDEPTAALDVRSEARFYEHFLEITGGLTTVVISHRFATVRRADAICVLDDGRITEHGTHDELVALDGTYARMYAMQAERFRRQR